MEKLEIVKLFLSNGLQLTPQVLERLFQNQEIIDKILKFAKQREVIIVDENLLEECLRDLKVETRLEIKVVYPEEIREFSVEDVARALKERFDTLSTILQENNKLQNLTSISRVKRLKKGEEATVIGMIKDKTTYSVSIEDFTSYETIQLDAKIVEKLFYDDVVAIKVRREDEKLVGDKVFYPSLSFFRRQTLPESEVIVSHLEIKVGSEVFELAENEVTRVYIGDFKLFIVNSKVIEKYMRKDEKSVDVLISLIERRHLNPSFFLSRKLYKKDLFLLDEIPDTLIVTHASEPLYKPYKGINIFFLPEGREVRIKEKRIE
jgi:DNA polymerase II small subunit/DNA polymerase delta subunit B